MNSTLQFPIPDPFLLDHIQGVADQGDEKVDQDDVGRDQVDSEHGHRKISGNSLGNFCTAEIIYVS